MKLKAMITFAVAGAFALPFTAQGSPGDDAMILAQAGAPSGASATGTYAPGGLPRTGGPGPGVASTGRPQAFTGHAIAAGTALAFDNIDRNDDGKISRPEWRAYRQAVSGASGGETAAPSASMPLGVFSPGSSRQPQPK